MNNNLTEIVVLIDRSGSMNSIVNDTIGGYNGFLKMQQESTDGKALLTLVTFNSSLKVVSDGVDIQEAEPLTTLNYMPHGGTALLDAIGHTIEKIENRYSDEEDESKIPSKVIFAIITDGEENSSKAYGKSKISAMIKHQTKRHGWEFAFLGANLDAVKEASSIGISQKSSFNFTANGLGAQDVFSVLNDGTLNYRSSGQAAYNIVGTSLEKDNQVKITSTTSE